MSGCPSRGARSRCRSISATPMATSCIFVHRGAGRSKPISVRCDFEPGDYINIPRAVTYRVVPETRDNFFLIIQSQARVRAAGERPAGPARALRSGRCHHAGARAASWTTTREWEVRIKADGRDFESGLSVQSARCGRLEGRPDGVEDQHARHPPGDEPSRASAAQRAHHLRHRRRGGVQFPAAAAGAG